MPAKVKTAVGSPEPEEPDTSAAVSAWLVEMGSKTDVELVSAYIASAQDGRPFIHPLHVVRILKLATLGLGGD